MCVQAQRRSWYPALAALPLFGWMGAAEAFDCKKASTATEQTICATPALRVKDAQLKQNYVAWEKYAESTGKDNCLLEDEGNRQRAWLKERDACGRRADCISDAYDRRINELGSYAQSCHAHDDSPLNQGRACAKSAVTAPTNPQLCTEADRVDYTFIKKAEGIMYDFYVPGAFQANVKTGKKFRAKL